jgi:predicted acylesterase/phospholipase RssA
MGPYTLIDGGVVNPVPTNVVAAMGARTVIGVKLARKDVPAPTNVEAVETTNARQLVVQTILDSIEMMQSKIITETAKTASILLNISFSEEEVPRIKDFTQGRGFRERGEEAMHAAMPRLAAAFPWLSA